MKIMCKGKRGMQVILIFVRSIFRSEDRWGRGPEANSSHPSEKKLPHSRGVWSSDETGTQLPLGGEEERAEKISPVHSWILSCQCRRELSPEKGQVFCCAHPMQHWLTSQAKLSAHKVQWRHKAVVCQYLSVRSSVMKPCSFQSPCTELPEMSKQCLLMAEFLHIYLQCKNILCFVKLIFLLCLLFKIGHHKIFTQP